MGNLVTCDLICLGAASPGAFQAYLAWLEGRFGSRVATYVHRGNGLPWGTYEEAIGLEDGFAISGKPATRIWKKLWGKYLLRPSCYRCAYHSVRRPGDLSIGDFWGIPDGMRRAGDELGISCVIASTFDGAMLMNRASRRLDLEGSSLSEISNPSQPMLYRCPDEPSNRCEFWAALHRFDFITASKKVGVFGAARAVKDSMKTVLRRLGYFSSRQRRDTAQMSAASSGRQVLNFERLVEDADYPYVFAARNRSDDIRRKSTSGGVFHALASTVIEQGGVVYGCAFDEDLKAVHVRCETIEECERCMGSKYSQSDMGDSIKRISADLEAGRTVLFTGTPCQVAAVKAACTSARGGGCF